MADMQPPPLKESALREIEARIAREPGITQLRLDRALLLTDMGRLQEAKQIYIDVLTEDPQQFTPFVNLGGVLTELGFPKHALKVYRDVVQRFPDHPLGHVLLALTLYKLDERQEARRQYEKVLRLAPDYAGAHYGLADVLMDLHEPELAFEHRRKASEIQPWTHFHYRGQAEPIRVLILTSAHGGNAPIQRFLDNKIFLTSGMYTDFHTPCVPLPPHQLIINAIGDAECCRGSLDAAEQLLPRSAAPVINLPAKVRVTGRAENARILAGLEGVITPKTANVSRQVLAGANAHSELERMGFTFPFLLRTPGFHGGDHFMRAENAEDLPAVLAQVPGEELIVSQFLDARDADGKIRKYRVMMIDGALYPVHKAVSAQWKIHYFSAEMADSPPHRAEDEAFLQDMASVLGPRALRALGLIRDTLGLDYAGADFSLSPQGDVLLFEANATMTIPPPGPGLQWDYRRAPVQRIHAAVVEMVQRKAGQALRV